MATWKLVNYHRTEHYDKLLLVTAQLGRVENDKEDPRFGADCIYVTAPEPLLGRLVKMANLGEGVYALSEKA